MLFFCACSDWENDLNPITQAQKQIAISFRCGEMSPTRAATADSRIDDINLCLFPVNGDPARHVYIAPVRSVVLELPKGDYMLYAVANMGENIGERSQDFVQSLRVEWEPLAPDYTPFPMSAEQAVSVKGDMQIAVSLVRAVAKVNFTYTVAPDFARNFSVKSIQLRNVPRSAVLFGSSHADSDGDVADMPPVEMSATTYTATYHLLENKQGQVTGIGSQQHKDQTRAPEYATYIAIVGEADGIQVVYRIYLGENNTTDFNVGRNRVYNIDARILGMNTVDWRVSTAELTVTPFAESYRLRRGATSELQLISTNAGSNAFYISYRIEKGASTVITIGGEERDPDTLYPLFSGNGTFTTDIAYIQLVPGEVRLRLTVTDEYGYSMERLLETRYIAEPLTLTLTQDMEELTAFDRAIVHYTISQQGYSGKYTVNIDGVPHFFHDLTTDNNMAFHYTVDGNGTYALRLRPEAVGPNAYTITVTDENGNSVSAQSSVTGIKTISYFTLDFRKAMSNWLDVKVECTYPVENDLTLYIKLEVNIIEYGSISKTKTYDMTAKVEQGRVTGSGSLDLKLDSFNADYYVVGYSVTFSHRTSLNGMVEYKLQ